MNCPASSAEQAEPGVTLQGGFGLMARSEFQQPQLMVA
jgi:hypothetical protein